MLLNDWISPERRQDQRRRESRGTKATTCDIPATPQQGFGRCIGSVTPRAVILGTPVITAIGCDNWEVGNPEEQSQPPVIFPLHLNGGQWNKGNTARPLDSARDKRTSSRMTARGTVSRHSGSRPSLILTAGRPCSFWRPTAPRTIFYRGWRLL